MRGTAIIISTGGRISPFGDPVGESMFADSTLAQTQDATFARVRFDVLRVASPAEAIVAAKTLPENKPVLLMLDRVFVTPRSIWTFVRAAKDTRPATLGLSMNASVDFTLPLQSVRREEDMVIHDVVLTKPSLLPAEEDDPVAWIRSAGGSVIDVPKREIALEFPLPTIGESEKQTIKYPITSSVVVSIEHWTHILWLNQLAFGIRWIDTILRRPLWAAYRAATAFSIRSDRLIDRFVIRGRRSIVHPAARLSGTILGDGVRVGPGSIISNSIIGANCVLESGVTLRNCVLGPNCFVTAGTFLNGVVSYPEATLGNLKLQVSLIGRGAYINEWAGLVDAKFVGAVKVNHRGQLVSSERAFLGSVLGHRAIVGAKIMVLPGREIPNDTVVVMRPDEIVRKVPDVIVPGQPLVRHRGTLVPLGEELDGTSGLVKRGASAGGSD